MTIIKFIDTIINYGLYGLILSRIIGLIDSMIIRNYIITNNKNNLLFSTIRIGSGAIFGIIGGIFVGFFIQIYKFI